MTTIAHTLYRCNCCSTEELVSDADILKTKLDGWLTVDVRVSGGSGFTRHYCPICQPALFEHHNVVRAPKQYAEQSKEPGRTT